MKLVENAMALQQKNVNMNKIYKKSIIIIIHKMINKTLTIIHLKMIVNKICKKKTNLITKIKNLNKKNQQILFYSNK